MSFIDRAVNGGVVIGNNLHREQCECVEKVGKVTRLGKEGEIEI